jgi:hypothetical protein
MMEKLGPIGTMKVIGKSLLGKKSGMGAVSHVPVEHDDQIRAVQEAGHCAIQVSVAHDLGELSIEILRFGKLGFGEGVGGVFSFHTPQQVMDWQVMKQQNGFFFPDNPHAVYVKRSR